VTEGPRVERALFALERDGPSTILVGFDGSEPAWRALHYAVGLARRQMSKIVAVYASQLPATSFAAPQVIPAMVDLRKRLAVDIQAVAREHGVDITFLASEGDPVTVLTNVANDHHVDLIVLGASDKITHRFFGSVALRTIKSRRCPVTVVP